MFEVRAVGQLAVGQARQILPGWGHQQQASQPLRISVAPAQGFVEPAGNHPVGEVRVQHDAVTLVRQVQVIVEHTPIAIHTIRRTGQGGHAIEHHGNGGTGQQRCAQIVCLQIHMVGGEIIERAHRQIVACRIDQPTLHK